MLLCVASAACLYLPALGHLVGRVIPGSNRPLAGETPPWLPVVVS
jgi:hypothetical protein